MSQDSSIPTKDPNEVNCHFVLLGLGAVVFDGEDERVVRSVERVRADGVLQHLFEIYLGGEGPAVVDDGLVAVAVPAVCKVSAELGAINSFELDMDN